MKKRIFSIIALALCGAISFYFYQYRLIEDERDFVLQGLIRDGAMYTFVGDKPVSHFGIYVYPRDSEIDMSNVISVEPPPIDKEKLTFSDDNTYEKDLLKLWKLWRAKYPVSGEKVCYDT